MAVGGIGGVGGVNLAQLAQQYRQQVMSGASLTGDVAGAGVAGVGTGAAGGASSAAATRGADFAGAIGNSLSALDGLDRTAQSKAVQAATGSLTDIHDYVIAANEAQVATELTTTVRNKALDAFNEIMRMPL